VDEVEDGIMMAESFLSKIQDQMVKRPRILTSLPG
jgi:hypothetical protein